MRAGVRRSAGVAPSCSCKQTLPSRSTGGRRSSKQTTPRNPVHRGSTDGGAPHPLHQAVRGFRLWAAAQTQVSGACLDL
jgi:hypothetical protein